LVVLVEIPDRLKEDFERGELVLVLEEKDDE
jgi:hypothetical protein